MGELLTQLFHNPMLISALLAWTLAQVVKLPIYYLVTGNWDWGLMLSSGGMPSSHSAIVSATSLSIGLFSGFDTSMFAVSFALAMIVIYDAAGVRRQAGFHAQKINLIIHELFTGHPISQEDLKEVIGHTPRQVTVGTIFGMLIALFVWLIWV